MNALDKLAACGLYRPEFEHDNCGFGLIAQIDGRPSHKLVKTAIEALGRMTHRGAIAADGKSGDGCPEIHSTLKLKHATWSLTVGE